MKDSLYIVDDHKMVRLGLKTWLETHTKWKVPGDFSSSRDCISFLEGLRNEAETSALYPEIVIIDVQLTDETGFKLLKELSQNYPDIKCVMYSMYDTGGYVLQARDYGAKGYVSKVAAEEELAECLETVQKGGTYLENRLLESQNKLDSVVSVLTKQERKIFEAILQGKTNEQISNSMFISLRTVETYTSRLYDKINVIDRDDLISRFK